MMIYKLTCPVCKGSFPDDGFRLTCPMGCTSLLHTTYDQPHEPLDETQRGIGRYHRRLPGNAAGFDTPLPVAIELPWLERRYPQLRLQTIFSGWWPERDAHMPSASFKDLEAAAVLARLGNSANVVVLASAGNTAAAFAGACTRLRKRCVIVITEEALERIQLSEQQSDDVCVVGIRGAAAYDDAIVLSRKLSERSGFVLEGGVRNVARRDGMGIALGVALEARPEMPDAYMQAIGSAAGAIAVFETARRAVQAGAATRVPRLCLSQNLPFAPVARSYGRRSRILLHDDEAVARMQTQAIGAQVLTNMAPPYAVAGGIYDAMHASGGDVIGIGNAAAIASSDEFLAREGVLLDGAAAVALASIAYFGGKALPAGSRVLLHLTGGQTLSAVRRANVRLRITLPVTLEDARSTKGIATIQNRVRDYFEGV